MAHSQSSKAKHPLAHVLILNKDPTHGLKEKTPISPSAPNVRVFAKGGAVKKFEGSKKDMAQDMAMDKSMLARHNRLMHPGQKSKLNKGGEVKKMVLGGGSNWWSNNESGSKNLVGSSKKSPKKSTVGDMGTLKKPKIEMLDDSDDDIKIKATKVDSSNYTNPATESAKAAARQRHKDEAEDNIDEIVVTPKPKKAAPKKDEPLSDDYFVKRAQRLNKDSAPDSGYKPSGYARGGAAKGGKKVLGTKAEAMKLAMLGSALKAKADAATSAIPMRRPMSMATPPAGLGAAPPSMPMRRPMAAPTAPGMPMKRGGKAMKKKC